MIIGQGVSTPVPPIAAPVLVLGATSLIGRFLLPLLDGLGMATYALSRKTPLDMAGARWVRVSLDDPRLEEALPEAATVFSLSPIWILPAALPALKAKGLVRLIAFSSTSVFTKAGSDDEGERRTAQKLADGEAAVIAFCEANGVTWTILRPTMIYAEGHDQNITRLTRLIRRLGFLPLAGKGDGLRQPVHAQDLAAGALVAAIRSAACNKAYDLPGGETLAYRQMAERIFQALGKRPLILTAPPWLWRLGYFLASPFLPGSTAQMGRRMSEDLVFSSAPAENDLNWNPRPFFLRFSKLD